MSESTAGDFGTYADGLPFENVAADARGPLDDPRYAPSGDQLGGGPLRPRRAVVIDADSGEHLADLTADQLRALAPQLRTDSHIRAAGGDEHLGFLLGGH